MPRTAVDSAATEVGHPGSEPWATRPAGPTGQDAPSVDRRGDQQRRHRPATPRPRASPGRRAAQRATGRTVASAAGGRRATSGGPARHAGRAGP